MDNTFDDSEYTEEERDIIGKKKRTDVFTTEASNSMAMLADLDRQVKDAMNKKQDSLRELRDLQQQLKSNQARTDARATESNNANANSSQEYSSPVRRQQVDFSEHHLFDLKLDSAKKELQSLEDQIASRKKMHDNQLGINTAEVLAIIEERDSLKKKLSSGEYAFGYLEKLELERQVNLSKEQLFSEQKTSRKNQETLQDELDESNRAIEEYQLSNNDLNLKIESLEKEIRNKTEEAQHREDQLRNEMREQRNEIEDRKVAEHRLSLDAADKDRANHDLQQIILEKEKQLSAEHESKIQVIREKNDEILALKQENGNQIREITARLESENKNSISCLEKKKSEEIKDILEKHQKEICDLKSSNCKIIENYAYDIEALRKALLDQEQKSSDLVRKLKFDFEDELKQAVHKERVFNEDEQTRLLNKEKNVFEQELKRVSVRLTEAVDYEKHQAAELRENNENLKRELDSVREKNKHYVNELLANHESTLESLRCQNHSETEALQKRLAADRETEVERLCKQIDELENALGAKNKEIADYSNSVNNFFQSFDHHEKTIVAEVNDLCKTLAETLEIDPRKVTSKFSPVKPHQLLLNPALQKTTTRSCLANLRATVTDLISGYKELQKCNNDLRAQHKHLRKETEQKLQTLTNHLNLAGEKERECLKEEMEASQSKVVGEMQQSINNAEAESNELRKKLKFMENEVEGLHKSMSKWKEETASKLSQTFEAEMKSIYLKRMKEEHEANDILNKQKLLIKLEDQVSKLRAEQALGKASATDPSTMKLVNHLQDRIRVLKIETSGGGSVGFRS